MTQVHEVITLIAYSSVEHAATNKSIYLFIIYRLFYIYCEDIFTIAQDRLDLIAAYR